jgi:hypothetical protein
VLRVPATHLLRGVWIKLVRAADHLDAIDTAARHFIEVELKDTVKLSKINPLDADWQEVRWESVPEVDPMLGAILGDFAHNVRSALDQLMWSVVLACGGEPGSHTYWPITESEAQWRDRITHRNIKEVGPPPTSGITEDALQLVEEFQPWVLEPRRPREAPLMRLSRLSNEDKHRTLHLGAAIPVTYDARPVIEPRGYLAFEKLRLSPQFSPIEEGAIFARLKFRRISWPPPEGVKVYMKAPRTGYALAFSTADGKRVGIVSDLILMLAAAGSIVEAFEELPEFPAT